MNTVASMKTVELDGADGPVPGIMMALNMDTPSETQSFVATVVEQFKVHRMCSPPTTSVLVISIIGSVDTGAFERAWCEHIKRDSILKVFLDMMTVATAVHGTPSGAVLEEFSLLPTS